MASAAGAEIAPPSIQAARRRSSRRCIISGVRRLAHRLPFLSSLDGVVGRARRECHVGERGVLATRRRHERAVGDEHILAGVNLVELVQHRFLRVRAHARRAHLVDAVAHVVVVAVHGDVLVAGRLEHLRRVVAHVLLHLALVVAHHGVDDQQWQAVLVLLAAIEPRVVFVVRQDFTERRHAQVPRTRLLEGLLELLADERAVVEAAESRARGAALVAEAAQVIALVLADVAITRNVEAIRPAAGVADVEVTLDLALEPPGLL